MGIAQNIKQLRKQKKISQEKLSELIGVSRQAVSKWENELSQPDTKNLMKLAEVLGVSLEELTGINRESQSPKNQARKSKKRISKLAILAYLISYSSIIGFFSPPTSNVPHPYLFWTIVGLLGGCLLVIKNIKLISKDNTLKILVMDIGVSTLGCLLGTVLPNKMGLVKQLIIVIPLVIYMSWVLRAYFIYES